MRLMNLGPAMSRFINTSTRIRNVAAIYTPFCAIRNSDVSATEPMIEGGS